MWQSTRLDSDSFICICYSTRVGVPFYWVLLFLYESVIATQDCVPQIIKFFGKRLTTSSRPNVWPAASCWLWPLPVSTYTTQFITRRVSCGPSRPLFSLVLISFSPASTTRSFTHRHLLPIVSIPQHTTTTTAAPAAGASPKYHRCPAKLIRCCAHLTRSCNLKSGELQNFQA